MRRRSKSLAIASLPATGILAQASAAHASVPQTLVHQGRLYDDAGAPVNATLDVEFTIYAGPVDMEALWTATHTVTFEDGYFSVALGTAEPLDAAIDGSERFLGITVGNDAEMTPRAAVESVPYALLAGDVRGDIHPCAGVSNAPANGCANELCGVNVNVAVGVTEMEVWVHQ